MPKRRHQIVFGVVYLLLNVCYRIPRSAIALHQHKQTPKNGSHCFLSVFCLARAKSVASTLKNVSPAFECINASPPPVRRENYSGIKINA